MARPRGAWAMPCAETFSLPPKRCNNEVLMPLVFRLANPSDHRAIESMVIESFEPITWFKKLEDRIGPLNGQDWRTRWHTRMRDVFANQIVLIGETGGEIAAMSSGTLDTEAALALIDLLAVDPRFQGQGYGREMLRGMMQHMQGLGAQYVYLDCLTDNDKGNALYRAEGFEEVVRQVRWFRKLS
jgi:RimJ/RimL family protein N-acetyltransferase